MKLKKTILFLLLFLALGFVVGCDRSTSEEPKLEISATKTTLIINEEVLLEVKVVTGEESEILSADKVTFVSSNPSVLEVSSLGVVKAIAEGEAVVTASTVYLEEDLEDTLEFKVNKNSSKPSVLENLKNVKIENGIVSWDKISYADDYVVQVNGKDYTIKTNQYDLKKLDLAFGKYSVVVYYKSGKLNSNSATVEFVNYNTVPPVPKNLQLNNGILKWSAIEGVNEYKVDVEAVSVTVNEPTLDLNTLSLGYGNFVVKVSAKSGSFLSPQATITYNNEDPALMDGLLTELLKKIDSSYEDDLEISDFIDEDDYYDYYHILTKVSLYVDKVKSNGVSYQESKDFFDFILAALEKDLGDIVVIKETVNEFFGFSLANSFFSDILLTFAEETISSEIDYLTDEYLYYVDKYEDALTKYNTFLASTEYADLVTLMNSSLYGDPKIVEYLLTLPLDFPGTYYDIADALERLTTRLIDQHNGINSYDWFEDYRNYGITYYDTLMDFILSNYVSNFQFIEDLRDMKLTFLVNHSNQSSVYYHEVNVNAYHSDLEQLNLYLDLLTNRRDELVSSIDVVLTFLENLSENLDEGIIDLVVELLESGELTLEEIFILKGEIIDLLVTTMPTTNDFKSLVLPLIILGNNKFELDITDLDAKALQVATIFKDSLDLVLEIADDFDLDRFTEITTLLEKIVTYGEWNEETNEYEDDIFDPFALIDAIVYFGNYYYELKDKYGSNVLNIVSELNGLLSLEQVLQIVPFVLENPRFEDMDEDFLERLDDTIFFIGQIIINTNGLGFIYEDAKTILSDVIKKFISTDGKIAKDILFIFFPDSEFTLDDFANNINGIIIQYIEYNELIFRPILSSLNNEEQYLEFFGIIKDLFVDFEEEAEPMFEFFEGLIPVGLDLFTNIIQIEIELLDIVSTMEAGTEFFELSNHYMAGEAMAIVAIKALDQLLTPANKQKINDSIDSVFTNFFETEMGMDIIQMDEVEVEDLYVNITGLVEMFIMAIEEFATYDFYALSESELLEFQDFMTNFFGFEYE